MKASWRKRLANISWRRIEDVLKTSWRGLAKTSWKCFWKTHCKYVLKKGFLGWINLLLMKHKFINFDWIVNKLIVRKLLINYLNLIKELIQKQLLVEQMFFEIFKTPPVSGSKKFINFPGKHQWWRLNRFIFLINTWSMISTTE